MKSILASPPSSERLTAKKQPNKIIDDETDRKKIPDLLLQKKKNVGQLELRLQQKIKRLITFTKETLTKYEVQLMQKATDKTLKLLQELEKCRSQDEMSDDFKQLLNFNIELNISEDSEEILTKLRETVYFLPLPNETSTVMTKQKYQQIIDRLRSKLEKSLIDEQRLMELKKQLEKKQPLKEHPLFIQRYKRQNEILVEENMKLANKTIELTNENTTLKEKLKQMLEQSQQQEEQIRRISTNSEKLQAKLNMPDRKLLEENRNMQKDVNNLMRERDEAIDRVRQLERQIKEVQTYMLTNAAESHSSKKQADQLKNQLQSEMSKSVQQQNKYLHLHNLYKLLQEEKEELVGCSMKQLEEISKLRQEMSGLVNKNKELDQQLTSSKESIHDLQNKIKALQQQQKQLNEEITEESSKVMRQFEGREAAVKDRQLLMDRMVVMESVLENIRKDKQSLEQATHHQEKTISALRAQNLKFLGLVKSKESEINSLQMALDHTKHELTAKKQNVESTKKKQEQIRKHQEEKAELAQFYNTKLQYLTKEMTSCRLQLQTLKQSFEHRRRLHQLRCKAMKQRFVGEVLNNIDKKKHELEPAIERLVESFSNFIHKQSIISKLKEEKAQITRELKKKTEIKKAPKKQDTEIEIKQLNNSILVERAKVEKSTAQEKIKIMQEKIQGMESFLNKVTLQRDQLVKANTQITNKFKQLENRTKITKQGESQLIKNIQETVEQQYENIKQELISLKSQLDIARIERDELKEDNKHKKQYIVNLKKQAKENEIRIKNLQKELQEERQQHSKTKKNMKEYQRKEQVYKENKEKIQSYRILEKQNNELKLIIEERSKQHKAELTKRENIIRQLKEKEQSLEIREVQDSTIEEELNQQLKKAKSQIDRKDQLIKSMRQKMAEITQSSQKQKRQLDKKISKDKIDLDREAKKAEQLRLQCKKLQSQLFSFKSFVKKLCRSLSQQQNTSTNSTSKPLQLSMYEESLSILQIRPDDLHHFLPEAQTNENRNSVNLQMMSTVEKTLQAEQVDVASLYRMVTSMIDKSRKS